MKSKSLEYNFSESWYNYKRYVSRVVHIGNIPLGGDNPIRIQSMLNTDTLNTKASVEQAIRLFDIGCEYVRLTAQGVKEAENLKVIKEELISRGYNKPLIADIHYSPQAAEIAAQFVEKIRINPGNYTDRKGWKLNATQAEYDAELYKIKEKISPLIKICKHHKTAIRIGSNHGSLSERIVNKYGDTALGMVEAAMEFIRICDSLDFHSLVISMKASNVKVMIESTRLLVARMSDEGYNYPIHLGVTEAGEGEDGRIKSAAGIGTLLLDGIGDTIRVSLTEEPEKEIPVAKNIIKCCQNISKSKIDYNKPISFFNPFSYCKRIIDFENKHIKFPLVVGDNNIQNDIQVDFVIKESDNGKYFLHNQAINDYEIELIKISKELNNNEIEHLIKNPQSILLLELKEDVFNARNVFSLLYDNKINNPVILNITSFCTEHEDIIVDMSIKASSLMADGFGDGIYLKTTNNEDDSFLINLIFSLLQALGERYSKAEFISCPSCGRTLYNIQETLSDIKKATQHLTGVKIAVMGCVVNGPGEMADAHYGYVGSGKGKVSLYKGKNLVQIGIDETIALNELINLIKTNGDWVDPN